MKSRYVKLTKENFVTFQGTPHLVLWKKAYSAPRDWRLDAAKHPAEAEKEHIIKLLVPAGAFFYADGMPVPRRVRDVRDEKLSILRDAKVRVSEAYVTAAYDRRGRRVRKAAIFCSGFDETFCYPVTPNSAEDVYVVVRPRTDYDKGDVTCASGIHGFLRRRDARAY